MTLHLTRYLGCDWRIQRDANGRRIATGCVWFPCGRRRYGYLYPWFPWPFGGRTP